MAIDRLLGIMARLRDPAGGCPWDLEQTWASIAPHTIEEAYELGDAIERGDAAEVRDELGDVLFQVVFQARIAAEQGRFDFDDVVEAISDKLERRHPHVFGTAAIANATEQSRAWEAHKAAERRAGGAGVGALDGIVRALPALTRAAKLGRRAASAGLDWPHAAGVLDKLREELAELDEAMRRHDSTGTREEIGDLLFTVAQFARHLEIDPEAALREAGDKFERRFRHLEARLAERGLGPVEVDGAELEVLWARAKQETG